MRNLLKQINDIQKQLTELQANVINILPAIEFASELFADRNMSHEEELSSTTVAPLILKADFIDTVNSFISTDESVNRDVIECILEYFQFATLYDVTADYYEEFLDTIKVTATKAANAKAESEKEALAFSTKAAAEKAAKETKSVAKRKNLQKGLKQDDIQTANVEPVTAEPVTAEPVAATTKAQTLIERTKEILKPEPATEPTPEPTTEPESTAETITYDDFKNAIYSFIKENAATNKPIVLNIFKERGYGFTSDVPEADYQLVLDLIKTIGA